MPPIGSIKVLAGALSVTQDALVDIALHSERYYDPNPPELKKSGGTRQHYTVLCPLERIQGHIKTRILNRVHYPDYIFGVPETDYVKNARLHTGKRIVIREDARDFYDSVPVDAVRRMWQYFFNFPPDVADLLTQLTTYKGSLPQGACTSTDIADLVFWDKEPQLEFTLRSLGFVYSRYVDDITVSSNQFVNVANISDIKRRIHGMLRSMGVKQNRFKAKNGITTSGHRQSVHGLNVNNINGPTLPKKYRNHVRQEVYLLQKMAQSQQDTPQYAKEYAVVVGKVAHVTRLHPNEGSKLKETLQDIKPTHVDKLRISKSDQG